jgi:hypothetical protein
VESASNAKLNAVVLIHPAAVEFETMNGISPHVKKLIEFLRERDMGKHGRYLESFRRQ